ncbi:MAG: hypothetical protein HY709_04700 [Candidatus Latescibacteria bacterium]|nr:hypothetical protein [Candidatus Latescibacterota bacterium]
MESSWGKIRQEIEERAKAAIEKTEELAKLGKAKLDISLVRRTINRSLTDLGHLTYHLIAEKHATNIETDRQLIELVETLTELYTQEREKVEVYERLKAERSTKPKEEEATPTENV